ncbi:MAG: TonB-dependent receptor [Hyphomonadaceae bacterium]|nr:TonB-dependent receptor [Hyphomonadaceae bacterium]
MTWRFDVKSWLNKDRLLAGTIIAGVSALGLAGPAVAQSGDEIIVTGSRIPQPNLVTTSPVTQITAEDVTTQGVTRIEDLVNQLPQAFAAQQSTVSNGASGTATVNLRGLGSARTLVLIDGRRMVYGSPIDAAADLNQIPGPLVERVEVLTGGASAVYGSDAVAGVVNFVMKKDFEGIRFDAQYGFYQHGNDYDGVGYLREEIAFRALTNSSQFALPDDVVDGYGKEGTIILGMASPDGKGNVTAYVNYRTNDAILQRDRDYSACALGAPSTAARSSYTFTGAHWTCGGSGTAYPGTFTDFATFSYTIGSNNEFRNFVAATDQYNFGPTNYYQRPDERYTLGAFGHYEITPWMEAYTQLMFSDYTSQAQIAPAGVFFDTSTINCDNPLLTATMKTSIGCTPSLISSGGSVPFYIGRRNVEGGGRQDNFEYESYRAVFGLRGPLVEGWDYDVSASYSKVTMTRVVDNYFAIDRIQKALDVIAGPGGTPVCRSGSGDGCVPYNVFRIGGVTQEALDYMSIPLMEIGDTTQQIVSATITGDLGFTSPAAETNWQVAFGVEYKRDSISSITDANWATANASGLGGPTIGLSGVVDNTDFFGELRAPLVEGKPFADIISLELAYRRSTYSTDAETETYKIGGDWAPTEDIRFRGSYQRAVRAANVIELFSAQGFNLFDMNDDPCDGTDPGGDGVASSAVCVGSNPWQVTAAQRAAGALTSPAGQYNFLQGGNPNVSPETADTYTIGFVFTPTFLEGFSLSVDWYEIKVEDLISIVSPDVSVTQCFNNNNIALCNLINRNPANGSLWVGSGNVVGLNTNIGYLLTSGYDVNASYSLDIGEMGGLNFGFVGTWLDKLKTNNGPGLGEYDCKGDFGGSACGVPSPEWRHRFRVSWETPWDLELSGTWRYYGEVTNAGGDGKPITGRIDSVWDAENYYDLAGNWAVKDNITFRAGVNNILDNDPQLSNLVGTTGNGNTFPQTYDALGRWVFAGITLDF